MDCPRLSDLPSPPEGLTGWPWTEESDDPELSRDQAPPRITVVTPSFNQASFLEAAIRSVLLQAYPNIEYIVLDGGSTDKSASIIAKYAPWLRHWESRPDGGQSEAINRGMRMGSGEWATWINSDDMLCKNALMKHAAAHPFKPDVVYAGICHHIDENGCIVETHQGRVHNLKELVQIRQIWRSSGYIDQPAVLFPLELAQSVGGLNTKNHRTMDYELWGKFFLEGATFQYTNIPFGAFRMHDAQKTADVLKQTSSLLETAASLVGRSSFDKAETEQLLADLASYDAEFRDRQWRGTGRLAKLGLPPQLVNLLRGAKDMLVKPAQSPRGIQR